ERHCATSPDFVLIGPESRTGPQPSRSGPADPAVSAATRLRRIVFDLPVREGLTTLRCGHGASHQGGAPMTQTDSSRSEPAASKATPLPTRRLGRTDMEITRVGFGAW